MATLRTWWPASLVVWGGQELIVGFVRGGRSE
jgi:hypothetical protein